MLHGKSGSESDYNSYNYIGYGYDPSDQYVPVNGIWIRAAGDEWYADTISAPNEWNAGYRMV